VLGLSLDGVPAPIVDEVAPAYAGPGGPAGRPAADEPVAAERRWNARRGPATPPPAEPTEQPTRTRGRTPTR
jgi:hypothetical protein